MTDHKQGCPALGGYGHSVEPCQCGADMGEQSVMIAYGEALLIRRLVADWAYHNPEDADALSAEAKFDNLFS